jgi:hypothetical protein
VCHLLRTSLDSLDDRARLKDRLRLRLCSEPLALAKLSDELRLRSRGTIDASSHPVFDAGDTGGVICDTSARRKWVVGSSSMSVVFAARPSRPQRNSFVGSATFRNTSASVDARELRRH